MTGNSLVVISPPVTSPTTFGSLGGLRGIDIDADDDFDILVTDDVADAIDPLDIPAEDIQNVILFPAGHPGYNKF
jgi:hypothetical protein